MNPTNAQSTRPSLAALLALPVPVQVGGLALPITPMGWYLAAQAMEPLMPVLAELPLMLKASDDKREAWAAAVMTYRTELNSFVALAAGLEAEEVRRLQPAHMLELTLGLVEVNADFFVQTLPMLAQQFGQRLQALSERLGPALLQATQAMKAGQQGAMQALADLASLQRGKAAPAPTSGLPTPSSAS